MAKEITNADDYIDSRDVEERIEELEDSISPRFVAGYNMPGYMPDAEPCEFDNHEEAKEYIMDLLMELIEDEDEHQEEYARLRGEMLLDGSVDAEGVTHNKYEEDFSVIVGRYCFWVKEDGEMGLDEWDQEELDALRKLKEQCEGYSDWRYGETLIRESAFTDYVQELCEDCGYISRDFPSWIEIDWERTASNVAFDYSTVDFDGVDYYIRSC